MTEIRVTAATHRGVVREQNEDSYGATGLVSSLVDGEITCAERGTRPFLAVVADGLGGHPCGEVASALAVKHLLASRPSEAEELVAAIHGADRAIVDAMDPAAGSVGMGATIVTLLVHAAGVVIANVGDSVALEYVGDRLLQLSTDDVPLNAGVPGMPSTVVTQTLGGAGRLTGIEPHVLEDAAPLPRRLLLATDGLTSFVPRHAIAAELSERDAQLCVERLLQLALDAGGADNVTCVLVDVS